MGLENQIVGAIAGELLRQMDVVELLKTVFGTNGPDRSVTHVTEHGGHATKVKVMWDACKREKVGERKLSLGSPKKPKIVLSKLSLIRPKDRIS